MTKILERAAEKEENLCTGRIFERAVGSLTFQLAYPLKFDEMEHFLTEASPRFEAVKIENNLRNCLI